MAAYRLPGSVQPPRSTATGQGLFRIELDDQLLLDILGNILTLRFLEETTAHRSTVPLQPRIAVALPGQGFGDDLKAFGLLPYGHHIAYLQAVRRNVHHIAVHRDVTVGYELTRCGTRRSDTQTVHHVVQTRLDP